MSNDRNEHFQGFAKLLWEDLETAILDHYGFIPEGERLRRDFLPMVHTLIAQRAYDLMEHIMLYAPAAPVPDLTEWPTEDNGQ